MPKLAGSKGKKRTVDDLEQLDDEPVEINDLSTKNHGELSSDVSKVIPKLENLSKSLPVFNGFKGISFIQSMPRYITNIDKPLVWVNDGAIHKLCASKKPKPQVLEFWVTGHVNAQYLRALRNYQSTYAIDLQVTDDVLAKIHGFWASGPQKEKAYTYQSPLWLKATFNDVKRIADEMGSADLPDVDLPLDEISDFPLIFDGSELTIESDEPQSGLPLLHLEEQSFVAVELFASAYRIRDNAGYKLGFKKIYTLGEKSMWKAEVEEKEYGPIAVSSYQKRSKKFYSEDNED
ncbi:hypothetical protein MMC29_006601 [Sticta canariensis]|nr:hypothetical protein [Sticta canariensis]